MRTLTLDQAAEVLNTTSETVSDCIHHRGLPAARIGRAYVLVDEDVIGWLRTQYGKFRDPPIGSVSPENEQLARQTLDRWRPPGASAKTLAEVLAAIPKRRRQKP